MKKLLSILALSAFLGANNLPADMVCKKIDKSDIERVMGTKYKEARIGKLPFTPPYDVSFCEYSNSVLPDVSVYYYHKSDSSVYPPDSKVEEIKGLRFGARAVYTDGGTIFEIIGDTKEGKLMFVFNEGLKKDSDLYKKCIKLLEKLIGEFK